MYILGCEEAAVQLCVCQVLQDIQVKKPKNNVWYIYRNAHLNALNLYTEQRKSNLLDSECHREQVCCSSDSQKLTSYTTYGDQQGLTDGGMPVMQRLKSAVGRPETYQDPGYESGTDHADATTAPRPVTPSLVIDVHEILLRTNPKTGMSSLVLYRLTGPGIYILAVDPATFSENKETYEEIIEEIGTYKDVTASNQSKLFIVDVACTKPGQKSKVGRQLFYGIRKTYFGNHCQILGLNDLNEKLCSVLLHSEAFSSEKGAPSLPQADIDLIFLENTKEDFTAKTNSTPTLLCFELEGQYFECIAPDKLVRDCICIFQRLEEKGSLHFCVHPVDTFLDEIDDLEEANKIMAALKAAGVIYEDETADTLYVLPLMFSQSVLNDEKFPVSETNTLRFTILDRRRVPLAVKCRVVMKCIQNGWKLDFAQTSEDGARNCFRFWKKYLLFVLTFVKDKDGSFVYMYMKEKENTGKDRQCFKNEGEVLKNEIKSFIEGDKIADLKISGLHVNVNSRFTDVSEILKNAGLVGSQDYENLLRTWFPTEITTITEKMNRDMSDEKLTKIAILFGKGFDLFFISQGISTAEIERVDKENPRDILLTIFQLLKLWRQKKGSGANFKSLRQAILGSNLQINLAAYDDIVNDAH